VSRIPLPNSMRCAIPSAHSTNFVDPRDRDLLMLMNLNGRERTVSAFKGLLASVEPKLRLQEVHRPARGELSLIEVVLDQ
jgi:hypothetical protein